MWKENWNETQHRFERWWNQEGLLVGMWGALGVGQNVHGTIECPLAPSSLRARYTDPAYRAKADLHRLSRSRFPLDVLPLADTDLGPGSLALFLGSTPDFGEDTVWFHPCMEAELEPESLGPLRFDEDHEWWRLTEKILRAGVAAADGRYLVPCPDLVENMDTLASLRGIQTLCMDLLERPEWVEAKIGEINTVWCEAYQRIYDIIKQSDGSASFGAFSLWAPGKVAKVQCDSSAMFSPQMYRRFVVPSLAAQCAWLDFSLYHLDGTQAMGHLDALLEIESLNAVEWTPQAGIETGGNPRWFDLYRRILGAGKSVQVVNVKADEIIPLLDAIGSEGVYLLVECRDEREMERIAKDVDPYRS